MFVYQKNKYCMFVNKHYGNQLGRISVASAYQLLNGLHLFQKKLFS